MATYEEGYKAGYTFGYKKGFENASKLHESIIKQYKDALEIGKSE